MKNLLLSLLCLLTFAVGAAAQDVITLTNGKQIQAKVLEVNPGNIRYKDFNNQDGPMITVLKVNVASIQYANGVRTLFNDGSETSQGKDQYVSASQPGIKKSQHPEEHKKAAFAGWYFGVDLGFGLSNASSQDETYTTSAGGFTSGNFLATRMFDPHFGIQFGLGSETYNYNVDFNGNSGYYGSDYFSLSCFKIPVRLIYLSSTPEHVGFYAMAGFDLSFIAFAQDHEQDNITSYYNTTLISPYLSCGVRFTTRRSRISWLIGPFYKASINNIYASNPGSTGFSSNSGSLSSGGISIGFMSKIHKRRPRYYDDSRQ